jgi:hypothetical protein
MEPKKHQISPVTHFVPSGGHLTAAGYSWAGRLRHLMAPGIDGGPEDFSDVAAHSDRLQRGVSQAGHKHAPR